MDLFSYDKTFDTPFLCGVDEAGRGPLAGDVYAAAVILKPDAVIEGLNDSKKLTEKKREALFDVICEQSVAYCIATASVEEIDTYNILNATFLAMKRAVEGLSVSPSYVLVDGNRMPPLLVPAECVVKGDATSASIAAASILAKVARDRYMKQLAADYPQYQFEKHKGYGTALHYECLDTFGVSPVHRKSFLKKYTPGEKSPAAQRGEADEQAVGECLKKKGYTILETNFHAAPYGEIDIVAQNCNVTAFVEVKSRKWSTKITPEASITPSKQKKIIKAAAVYVQSHPDCTFLRFDAASVYFSAGELKTPSKIVYLEQAFDGSGSDTYF